MRPDRALRRYCALSAAIALAGAAWAGDWPHWRGPERNGVVAEASGWPSGWPPKRLWSRSVGDGCTSPILVGGKLYVMGWAANTDSLYCLDARTGRELWKQSYPCPRYGRFATGDQGEYGGPSSTPSFDVATGYIYTLSIDGHLHCWDAAQQGKPVWAKKLYEEFKMPQRPYTGDGTRDYGYSSSPLVLDDLLIVEVGAPTGTVMAFDKKTGERRWASQYNRTASHNTGPLPMKVEGKDCLALLTVNDLVVMRIDKGHEGRTVATTKWETEFACNVPTPAVVGSRVLITSAYNHKTASLFEVTLGGIRQKWQSRFYGLASTPVVYRDHVYLIFDAVQCLDLATGELKWRGGSLGNGSCIVTAADNRLIAFGNGKLVLLDALPADRRYHELSRLEGIVRATCYPHVALADGVLCCKDKKGDLVCLSVRSVPPPPDKTPPGLHSAVSAGEPTRVVVRFSEPVDKASAESLENYALDGGAKVTAARLADGGDSVTLTTSALREDVTYTLAVSGVADRAKPANTMSASSRASFRFTPTRRTIEGLVALYTVEEGRGETVGDASGVGAPLDLRFSEGKWVPGGLAVEKASIIESAGAAAKIIAACRKSNEITIEAWLRPANTTQNGPARIVSLSKDPYNRNFTLGQEGASYNVRLRTTSTGENGMNPSLSGRGADPKLTHVAYTRDAEGKATLYVNGAAAGSATIAGDLGNWDDGFRFALANELTNDRPWLGELHLVAIYSRALTPQEVQLNQQAGPEGKTERE